MLKDGWALDARVNGILLAHARAFCSGELIIVTHLNISQKIRCLFISLLDCTCTI